MAIASYRDFINRAFNESRPLSAQWELTFKCNHLCSFCYNAPNGQREMTTDEIKRGLEKIAEFGVLYLTLTGGEPMVRPDFFDIATYARELGFAIRIYSNGYLIDEARARRLKEIHTFEIEISIHGARPETHDALTGIRGSFAKVISALENLQKYRIKTNLKCPITHLNQSELWEIHEIGKRYGSAVAFDPVITPRDDGDKSPLALSGTKEFLVRFFSDEFKELRYGRDVSKRDDTTIQANCGTGRKSFTIDPYGNIYPCVQWRRKWANIQEVEDLDVPGRINPILTGDYAAEQAGWESTPIEIGRPLEKPTPLFAKLDPSLGETGPTWAPITR